MPGVFRRKVEKVSFSAWNIRGISDRVYGDKLNCDSFINSILNIDFVLLTETWTCRDLNIPGYRSHISIPSSNKPNCSTRLSGGLCLLFKEKFADSVTLLNTGINFIWCKLNRLCFGLEKDIYICGVYIPPQNSTYFSPDIFEQLENDINFYSSQGSILLFGDLNARTGKYNDFIETPHRCFLDVDIEENVTPIALRKNCDNVLNEHGKALLNICKNSDLRATLWVM